MSCTYLIAHVDVTDPVQYEQYKQLSSAAMQAHGAQVCIRGGAVDVLEGDWHPSRLVMLKFPNETAARTFYNSKEYTMARAARSNAATMRMIVVQGID